MFTSDLVENSTFSGVLAEFQITCSWRSEKERWRWREKRQRWKRERVRERERDKESERN